MVVELITSLREVVFPSLCACCGDKLSEGEVTICTRCRYDMPLTYYADRKQNYVVDLLAGRVDFDNASALMFFRRGSDFRALIHRMKYGGRGDVARALGVIYGRYLRESKLYDQIDLIVPVPLHWTRMIRRGYNQSREFAEGIAEAMGAGVEHRAMRRVRRTHVQARMDSVEQRARNVRDAFVVCRPELIDSYRLLVVDDVITTGATLEAAVEAINKRLPETRVSIGAMAVVDRS